MEPSEMGGENEYELDKIKIKKSQDRMAKRARNSVNTSQLSKPQNGGTTAEEAESVTNVADNVKIANMKDTPQNKQLMNNSSS